MSGQRRTGLKKGGRRETNLCLLAIAKNFFHRKLKFFLNMDDVS